MKMIPRTYRDGNGDEFVAHFEMAEGQKLEEALLHLARMARSSPKGTASILRGLLKATVTKVTP